jgi:GNAT superfamily N-acetyltransferase
MELISNYMTDDSSRKMLNELTQKTFGFDFEGWVRGGYFEGDYIPYSLVEDGRMLANVSANRMHFMQRGVEKNYIQTGTVMTDESYRKQGLGRKLMEHVISTYENECDGIYLFGNLSAVEFYKKLGFRTINEYRYFVKEEYCRAGAVKKFVPVNGLGEDIRKRYQEMVRSTCYTSSFEQINKYALQMFYTAGMDNVSYAEDIDCFIVTDDEDGLVLQSVICKEKVSLTDVIGKLGLEGGRLRLGFTPLDEDMDLCTSEIYDGADDYRLFYRGDALESIERDRLYFPELSHA